ncbi:MAG: hypothetical protein DWQ34_23395 [Planctomycetota bacterium]|nr:MAG: hypothetical protein DWQ34_23395 [Planctomycetota bacterium]REJ95432.1 MAG: hypothetical protein DWQ29_01995 [Planctomycetota bacterium]REK24181.1 MAG: hypothetical protein DWQ41_14155 [Planctomycetota bacterium]REK28832.1 MAG: hypothetical protein DWQ45_24360 [Planctomycetota bacterium]
MRIRCRICAPIPSRPCEFCLSLQDDSVFADFDVNETGCLVLARISFDGFGCCATRDDIEAMCADDSRALLKMIEDGALDSEECDRILRAYFQQNRDVIWPDALDHHALS